MVAGRIAVLGERERAEGYALGGALVVPADSPAEVLEKWQSLPADVALVVLTPAARAALGAAPDGSDRLLTVVMPAWSPA